jgi:hypothetical protein
MYSFIKSTNLDSWNRRQLTFMERGGNNRLSQATPGPSITSRSVASSPPAINTLTTSQPSSRSTRHSSPMKLTAFSKTKQRQQQLQSPHSPLSQSKYQRNLKSRRRSRRRRPTSRIQLTKYSSPPLKKTARRIRRNSLRFGSTLTSRTSNLTMASPRHRKIKWPRSMSLLPNSPRRAETTRPPVPFLKSRHLK